MAPAASAPGAMGSIGTNTPGTATAGSDATPPPGSGAPTAPAPGTDDSATSAPLAAGPLFPANGAKDVCPDPSLRLHFTSTPSVGSSGKIRVFKSASPSTPVATVDLAASMVSDTVGGTKLNLPRPVYVADNEVIVRLPQHSLSYGGSYYVTVDAGAITARDGSPTTFTSPTDWQFSTAAAAPTDTSQLSVAAVGGGQFCSVQGALEALPASGSPSVITVAAATYFEAIQITGKTHFTLRGADRKGTRIVGTNNNNLNGGTTTRALVDIEKASDVVIENLTIQNLTPQGGSQAEALRLQACDKCVVRHTDILSLQDTLLWSGRIYAQDCYIAGNVDYIWGTGAVFFDRCEIKTVGRNGYIVQSRNEAGAFGYVFVNSKLTADSSIKDMILARIDSSVYPGSQVAFINCQMGSFIAPAGWLVTGGGVGSTLRFGEYKSTDASGKPLDVSRRLAGSKQLSDAEAQQLQDPAQVLGGWIPPQ
jgi:pectin methylesterase-like acyl-CoA thioesterase